MVVHLVLAQPTLAHAVLGSSERCVLPGEHAAGVGVGVGVGVPPPSSGVGVAVGVPVGTGVGVGGIDPGPSKA